MFDRAGRYEYTVQGHANVWAVEMGSRAENGSFDSFVASFREQALTGDTHHCTYISPSQGEMTFGWGVPLCVEKKEIDIHNYPRYDTPWGTAPFDGESVTMRCGEDEYTFKA